MTNLTDKQYLELTKLSYIYEEAFHYVSSKYKNNPIALWQFANDLKTYNQNKGEELENKNLVNPTKASGENGYMWPKSFIKTFDYILNDPILSKLEIVAYENKNTPKVIDNKKIPATGYTCIIPPIA